MPNAARQGDNHTCPSVEPGPTPHVGGPIQSGSPDVEIEFMPAARAGVDAALCQAGGPDKIAQGSGTVLINNKHAARVGDLTSHAGVIVGFAGTVEIGVPGDAVTVLPIKKRVATSASQGDGGGKKAKDKGNPDSRAAEKASTGQEHTSTTGTAPPPTAVIQTIRQVKGNYFVGEPVTFRSNSYDQVMTASPDNGITAWKWRLTTPRNTQDFTDSQFTIQLMDEGDYSLTLVVTNGHAIESPPASASVRVGGVCEQFEEELNWLESYVDDLISNAQSSLGSFFGFTWAGEMLARYREGLGGELFIDPDRVRGLATIDRESSNVAAVLIKNVIPDLEHIADGQSMQRTRSITRSFNAIGLTSLPSLGQFYASGGSVLQSQLTFTASRHGRTVSLFAEVEHNWSDIYNWDNGKITLIPWPSTTRFPYLIQQVNDTWFNRLRLCRGIGVPFTMRSTWYSSTRTTYTVGAPMLFVAGQLQWIHSRFPPSA